MLCQGLYRELTTSIYLEKERSKHLLGTNHLFSPKRAVVAIPNSFTAGKIHDMVQGVKRLNQFKEVRCIYEAEANLIYYLFKEQKDILNSNVLLFDMGGATINATLVSLQEQQVGDSTHYNIDILGKLGYGIGGDTIDFLNLEYLHETLKKRLNVFPKPSEIGEGQRQELVELALTIKKSIIERFEKNQAVLVDFEKLASKLEPYTGDIGIARDALEQDESTFKIDPNDELVKAFAKNGNDYPIFKHEQFKELLFNNVQSVVNDIQSQAGGVIVDHIIYSGRSVLFPKIKSAVINSLRQKKRPEEHQLEVDKLKSAVSMGACLYGMNQSRIHLNTAKAGSSIVVKRRDKIGKDDIIPLVEMGALFPEPDDEFQMISNEVVNEKGYDFGLDGSTVNFYQVMAGKPTEVFEKQEMHKYTLLKQLRIQSKVEKLGAKLYENDHVECGVKEMSKPEKWHASAIKEQEVSDANADHYTWMTK